MLDRFFDIVETGPKLTRLYRCRMSQNGPKRFKQSPDILKQCSAIRRGDWRSTWSPFGTLVGPFFDLSVEGPELPEKWLVYHVSSTFQATEHPYENVL